MKKQSLVFFLCFLLAFPYPVKAGELPPRALFVSVIQDPQVLSSRDEMTKLIEFAKKANTKTLFVQIYRANQAWFPSKVGDSKPYEQCLKAVGEDPFALLIKEAHAAGLEVHAWLNLMSLSANKNAPLLKKYGPSILTRNKKWRWRLKKYKIDNQYFLEPGDLRVRKELADMVGEILTRYPALDGIQFDYIRYPDRHPQYGYTKMNMERFKKTAGVKKIKEETLAWKDWKRKQVTELLETLIEKTHSIRPDIQISTTGLMPYSRAYHEGFQDWRSWLDRGIVHFVTLMCYIRTAEDFDTYILNAKKNAPDFKQVNIAVGAYAFLKQPEIFEKQFAACEKANARACVVFHYGSTLENPALKKPLIPSEKSKPGNPACEKKEACSE